MSENPDLDPGLQRRAARHRHHDDHDGAMVPGLLALVQEANYSAHRPAAYGKCDFGRS